MTHSDIVVELENYVGSAKAVRLMADAAAEINLLRDAVEREYARYMRLQKQLDATTL
jgi:hypothetical protein